MKQLWFKTLMGVLAIVSLRAGNFFTPHPGTSYQGAATPSGVFVTVTYPDPINVRGGPNTVAYPILGQLVPGAVVPALGVSPGHEWVKISFPSSPDGTGWVYATFVTVSGGELRVVEAPPTPTLAMTPTIDLTLAAAFETQPTQTRMPTFTPPPPLTVPQFTDAATSRTPGVFGIFIVVLGALGGTGLLASFLLRKS